MIDSVRTLFFEMEGKEKLLDIEFEQYHPWIYLRSFLLSEVEKEYGVPVRKNPGKTKNRITENIDTFFNIVKSLAGRKKNISLKKADIIFMASPARVFEQNEYWCPFTDALADLYGERSITLEHPHYFISRNPPHTCNLYYLDYENMGDFLLFFLKKKFPKMYLSQEEKENIQHVTESIVASVERYFSRMEVNRHDLSERITEQYSTWKEEWRRYSRVLEIVRPRVLVWARGNNHQKTMTEVAKSKGITVIELQHGAIERDDIRYYYHCEHELAHFPDYICLWGDYWKDIVHFPIPKNHLISCGFPLLEKRCVQYKKVRHDSLSILVISQQGVIDRIGTVLRDFVRLMEQNRISYMIYYKYHPDEREYEHTILKEIENEHIQIISDNKINVYELFSISDIQIGAFSTALFEGLCYDLKTYIIDNPCVETYMADLISGGYAEVVKDGKDLYDHIVSGNCQNQFNSDLFFKKDSLNNIKNFIDELL